MFTSGSGTSKTSGTTDPTPFFLERGITLGVTPPTAIPEGTLTPEQEARIIGIQRAMRSRPG